MLNYGTMEIVNIPSGVASLAQRTYEVRPDRFLDLNHKTGRVTFSINPIARRWIGKCSTCGAKRKLEGALTNMRRVADGHDRVGILSASGELYMTAENGSSYHVVRITCGGPIPHWCKLEMVVEGKRPSRHECNAKCLSSTGPVCECKCRGANHGGSAT